MSDQHKGGGTGNRRRSRHTAHKVESFMNAERNSIDLLSHCVITDCWSRTTEEAFLPVGHICFSRTISFQVDEAPFPPSYHKLQKELDQSRS